MKIGILTFHRAYNYGAFLQAFALKSYLEDLGHDVCFIDYWPYYHERAYRIWDENEGVRSFLRNLLLAVKRQIRFNSFKKLQRRYLGLTEKPLFRMAHELEKLDFDLVIYGSDQIWCTTTLYVDPMMYLRFAPKDKRIAYAPSLGRDYIPGYNKRTMRKYINDIPCVSVREEKGKELIKELTGRDVPVVLDPSLLLTSEDWDKLKVEVEKPSRYVLCYFLDVPSDTLKNSIMAFAKKRGLFIFALGQFGAFCHPEVPVYYPVTGPCEFLDYVSKATVVITDSYHGMLFSINYKELASCNLCKVDIFDELTNEFPCIIILMHCKESINSRRVSNCF